MTGVARMETNRMERLLSEDSGNGSGFINTEQAKALLGRDRNRIIALFKSRNWYKAGIPAAPAEEFAAWVAMHIKDKPMAEDVLHNIGYRGSLENIRERLGADISNSISAVIHKETERDLRTMGSRKSETQTGIYEGPIEPLLQTGFGINVNNPSMKPLVDIVAGTLQEVFRYVCTSRLGGREKDNASEMWRVISRIYREPDLFDAFCDAARNVPPHAYRSYHSMLFKITEGIVGKMAAELDQGKRVEYRAKLSEFFSRIVPGITGCQFEKVSSPYFSFFSEK